MNTDKGTVVGRIEGEKSKVDEMYVRKTFSSNVKQIIIGNLNK